MARCGSSRPFRVWDQAHCYDQTSGLAALVLMPFLVSGAQAFDFFGIKLFEDQSETDAAAVIADPQAYSATLETDATGDLEQAIRGASSLIAEQDGPASGAAGLLARAKGDYKRILAALYARGYYGGVISILVDGREAANLPPDTRLPDPASVVIRVQSGPEFHFGRLAIANRAPPALNEDDIVRAPEAASFESGEIAKSTVIVEAEQLAVEAWRQQGHANAAVAKRDVVADHRTNTVDVRIELDPGPLVRIGDIAASGTVRMDPEFVVQQTGLRPGDEYDPDDMARAEKRLARLDVFRAMRIEAAGSPGRDGLQPYNVIVEEQAERRFGIGATYSSIDGLGLEGFHLWRNLFGRAERLRLDARIAGINWPVNSAEFDYAFGGTFTKPGFLDPDNDLVAALLAERSSLANYDETSASASVGMTQYFSDELTFDESLYYERSQFEDDFGLRNFSIAGLTGGGDLGHARRPHRCASRLLCRCAGGTVLRVLLRQPHLPHDGRNSRLSQPHGKRPVGPRRARQGRRTVRPADRRDAARSAVLRRRRRIGARLRLPRHRRRLSRRHGERRALPARGLGRGPLPLQQRLRRRRLPRRRQCRRRQPAGDRPVAARGRPRAPLLHRPGPAAARRRRAAHQAAGQPGLRDLCRHRTGILKRLIALLLVCLGLAAALPLVAQEQMSPEEQKDWFVQFVEGQLSTPDRQIRISNIDGVLSSTASIREITISDQQGVWLRINNAAIDWDQGALFTGRLLVRSLTADSIEYLRNAIPSGETKLPSPEASPLQVPEFPVAIQLDKLAVPKVTFGESVFGLGSEISLDGSLRLEGGSLTAALQIVRLDGPGGRLDTDIAFRNADKTVDVAVTLTEPPNGIVANLLNIEGRPEVALALKGSGPVNNLVTTMTLDAGGRRALAGTATIAEAPGGLAVNAQLGGPIAELVAPPYRPFFGASTALEASALVRSAGGFEISGFKLTGGQLSLEGSGATTSDGFLSRLLLAGRIADPAGDRVVLARARRRDQHRQRRLHHGFWPVRRRGLDRRFQRRRASSMAASRPTP